MKKGFTLIELLATIIILGTIMLIAVPSVNKYVLKTEDSYYEDLEKTFRAAAIDYAADNRSILPNMLGNVKVIEGEEVEKLVQEKYMDTLKDTKEKECEEAKIVIVRNGINDYEYIPCIKCGDYQSTNDERCNYTEENNRTEYDIVVEWQYVGSTTAPESFPSKGSGYHVSEVSCDKASANWNDYTWEIEVDYEGYTTTCMVSVDDGDNNPMTEELETKEDELKMCQNEVEDLDSAKTYIVNGINGAFPTTATSRVTTSSTWQALATYISGKMYKYQTIQTGSQGFILDGSSSGDNRTASGTITFPTAYSSTPTVVASASHAQHAQCSLSISNITNTSFKYSVTNTAAGRGTCTINWFSY